MSIKMTFKMIGGATALCVGLSGCLTTPEISLADRVIALVLQGCDFVPTIEFINNILRVTILTDALTIANDICDSLRPAPGAAASLGGPAVYGVPVEGRFV